MECYSLLICGGRENVFIQDGEQHSYIFETSVHALAVKWDHSMSGIADDDG
jgi:hypothetical protein